MCLPGTPRCHWMCCLQASSAGPAPGTRFRMSMYASSRSAWPSCILQHRSHMSYAFILSSTMCSNLYVHLTHCPQTGGSGARLLRGSVCPDVMQKVAKGVLQDLPASQGCVRSSWATSQSIPTSKLMPANCVSTGLALQPIKHQVLIMAFSTRDLSPKGVELSNIRFQASFKLLVSSAASLRINL